MSKLARYTRFALDFLGPVAGAISGQLSKPEMARALAKAVVVGSATGASMAAIAKDQDTLTDVAVPLAAAGITGVLDALSRFKQGDPKTPPAEGEPKP